MNTRAARHFIIASYYFPPLGLAGTARPLAMANYLAETGSRVSVITVKPIAYPVLDESQLAMLHPQVEVYRVGSTDPARVAKLVPFVRPLLKLRRGSRSSIAQAVFPDTKVGFVKPAARRLETLIQPDQQTILITTSPPMSIHQLGLKTAEHKNLTWVADFRDIWGSLSFAEQSESFTRQAHEYLRKITETATLVTATSPATLSYLRAHVNAATEYHFLPNGFDESDFAEPQGKRTECFGLYGTLNHLVGVEKLLNWIGELRSVDPAFKLPLRHIGYLDLPEFTAELARRGLEENFCSMGYLPHHPSIQAIRTNTANIIMLSDQRDTSFIIPSKLFELLRAEPPLIVILPPGNAARRLLEEYRFEGVHIVDSADELGAAVAAIRLRDTTGKRIGVERFERRQELSEFLRKLEEFL